MVRREKDSSPATESYELFNLAEDPSEKTNLADKNPEKLQELKSHYALYASAAIEPKNLGETSE